MKTSILFSLIVSCVTVSLHAADERKDVTVIEEKPTIEIVVPAPKKVFWVIVDGHRLGFPEQAQYRGSDLVAGYRNATGYRGRIRLMMSNHKLKSVEIKSDKSYPRMTLNAAKDFEVIKL